MITKKDDLRKALVDCGIKETLEVGGVKLEAGKKYKFLGFGDAKAWEINGNNGHFVPANFEEVGNPANKPYIGAKGLVQAKGLAFNTRNVITRCEQLLDHVGKTFEVVSIEPKKVTATRDNPEYGIKKGDIMDITERTFKTFVVSK